MVDREVLDKLRAGRELLLKFVDECAQRFQTPPLSAHKEAELAQAFVTNHSRLMKEALARVGTSLANYETTAGRTWWLLAAQQDLGIVADGAADICALELYLSGNEAFADLSFDLSDGLYVVGTLVGALQELQVQYRAQAGLAGPCKRPSCMP